MKGIMNFRLRYRVGILLLGFTPTVRQCRNQPGLASGNPSRRFGHRGAARTSHARANKIETKDTLVKTPTSNVLWYTYCIAIEE